MSPKKFLPRYIAICGHPKSGKSLVQNILHANYSVEPVDDGFVLRDTAMRHFGAKHEDVFTQEGKAKLAYWPNGCPIIDARGVEHMTWRQLLGRLGEQFEAMFGEYVMPMCATARLAPGGSYSFGSVRKTQGAYFRAHGGVVIEVCNPMGKPSGNAFDLYDESLVDFTLNNDFLARGMSFVGAKKELEREIDKLVTRILLAKAV